VVLGLVHWILGLAVDRQEMSVAGLPTTAMSVSTWSAGGLLAAFLLLCGGLLLRTALTDRTPRRLARWVLIGAAGLHAVLASLTVGLVGWAAFAALMVGFGMIVLTLTMYPPDAPVGAGASGGPQVGDGDAELGEEPAQQGQR
jgi:hypothetical protein